MPGNTTRAAVRRTLIRGKKLPDCLTTLDAVCSTAAQSTDVQNSPVAKQALDDLQKAVAAAQTSLSNKLTIAQSLLAAIKTLGDDFAEVKVALASFETAVDTIAKGDATVINKAGLLSRVVAKAAAASLQRVSVVRTKPGKNPTEAIVTWPAAPGATGYAVEVNFTPQVAGSPWTAHGFGSGRRRVVKGAAPAAQFLVRVASVASDSTQADWSDPVLATAL
jgi:hypothetical protein